MLIKTNPRKMKENEMKENACKINQISGGKLSRIARTKFNFYM